MWAGGPAVGENNVSTPPVENAPQDDMVVFRTLMKTGRGVADDSPPPVRLPPGYDEVPIHEPDLSKQPARSALKGSKIRDHFRRQLEAKMLQRQSSGGSVPRVAPKPRFGYVWHGIWIS